MRFVASERIRHAPRGVEFVRTEEGCAIICCSIGDTVPSKYDVKPADTIRDATAVCSNRILFHQLEQSLIDARFRDLLVVQLRDHAKPKRRERFHHEFGVAHRTAKVRQTGVLVSVAGKDQKQRMLFVFIPRKPP